MSNYIFSIGGDFPSGFNAEAFEDELLYDFAFADFGLSTSGDEVTVSVEAPLSSGQVAALNEAVAAHLGVAKPFEKKHLEKEYYSTRIVRETWWARSSGDTLSVKVEETLYNYSGSRLIGEETKQHNRAGAVTKTQTWIYRQEKIGQALRVRKVEQ